MPALHWATEYIDALREAQTALVVAGANDAAQKIEVFLNTPTTDEKETANN